VAPVTFDARRVRRPWSTRVPTGRRADKDPPMVESVSSTHAPDAAGGGP
jgi:hypothetical protein